MSSTRFHKAAKDGLLEVLKESTSSDVNKKDQNGMTPVLWAAFEGKLDALRLLVGRGGDPDKRDQFGNTALHCAAAKGHMNCVDFLVKFGINFYALDIDGHNAKDLAAINNREDILRYLDAAITHFEQTDKKKAKTYKESAEKKYDKLSKQYSERVQKLEEEIMAPPPKPTAGSKLSRLWKGTIKGQSSTHSAMNSNSNNANNGQQQFQTMTAAQVHTFQQQNNFSSFVNGSSAASSSGSIGSQNGGTTTLKGLRGTLSIVNRKSTAVKNLNKQQRQQMANPFDGGSTTDFKIGDVIEPESGKRSVRSIHGLRRDSEVLFVGTFHDNPDNGKRGAIGNLFDGGQPPISEVGDNDFDPDQEEGEEEEAMEVRFANGKKFSTISRSLSQPNFFQQGGGSSQYDDDDDDDRLLSEEVLMQRPSGIFNRPSLGNLAIGRSVTATLSQMESERPASALISGKKKQSIQPKPFQPRLTSLSNAASDDDEDSDTDVASSDEEEVTEESKARNSYVSLERFLTAYDLIEYFPVFQKQKIDLDTLMILTESDVKSLELPLGVFRRLMNAIQLRNNALKNPGPIADSRV